MTDLCTTESGTTTSPRTGLVATRALAVAALLMWLPLGAAQADWESEFHDTNTYWGLTANIAFPGFPSDQLGGDDSRPYYDLSAVDDVAGGLSFYFGYRVHPYMAWEVAVDWVGGVEFTHSDLGTPTAEKLDILTGSIHIKGYPLAKLLDTVAEGRIQPYFYLAPGLIGALGSTIKTPVHFGFGLGGGVDYWLNESWTVQLDVKHVWAFGNVEGLDFTTLGFGGAYHF